VKTIFNGYTAVTPLGQVDMVPFMRRLNGDMSVPVHDFERDAGVLALHAMNIDVQTIAHALNMSFTSVTEVVAGKRTLRKRRPAVVATKYANWQKARERRYSERVLIDGRLVYPGANHGTNSAYHSWGCRCIPCCDAHRLARRKSYSKKEAA